MANENERKTLDYEGLKVLVSCVLNEIPVADNTTIVRNEDGTISAKTSQTPEVDTSTGSLVFANSPAKVNEGTLIF